MTITGVSATTNDTLPSTIYSMCSPYGMRESDKVKVERYLADYPVTEAQANEIVAKVQEAIDIMKAAGTTKYSKLTSEEQARIKTIANEIANIIDVTLVLRADSVEVYKNGKLIETVTFSNTGKLAYTGNNNIVLVVSSIAIIALATVAVARKKVANA